LPVLCWMAEPDGHVYWYNQRWYDFTGTTPPEMEGWGWQSVYDPEALPSALERWRASLATGEPFEMTFPLRGADGVFRMFLTRIVPVHDAEGRVRRWLGTNVDVAEAAGREAALERSAAALREREARLLRAHNELESRVVEEVKAREAAQARLAQAEKLSALGQLAGGIAHDFNNVMQAVSGGASLIGRHADSEDTVKRLSKIVEDAAWRGASVTRRLLAFARRGELRAAPVQISALLYGMREILAHTLGAAVKVELDVAQGLPAVLADGSQLESVVVNLATNARDAMPQGGTITIAATSERIIDNGHVEGLEPGTYVRLTVADTGTGIEAATLQRVMEPFFTTKEQGKGTGLGLPMARGFAQQSGGALTIASDPGLGTMVALWLPLSDTEIMLPDHSRKIAVSISGEKKPRLLVVEDEELVREVIAEQLIDRGYDVIEAEGGRRALALLDAGCPVDLIISDLSMPGMDGISLIRAAQIRKPRLPAILLTGYAGETAALAVGRELNGSFSLLRKPVTGDHLADRVATLLEAAAMGGGGEAAVPLGWSR
jgi:PAS domain S-box-containing protein